MPKVKQKLDGPRLRPISCKFCRTRKLRCSREAPCSNCVSRGIRCDLKTVTGSESSSNAHESEIVDRLNRLEELLLSQRSTLPDVRDVVQTPDTLSSSGSESQARVAQSQDSSSQELAKDVATLESIYTEQESSQGGIPSSQIVFRICPIYDFMTAQRWFLGNDGEPTRCVWFPQYAQAQILLAKYLDDLDHCHHVTHNPSLLTVLKDVYTCLGQGGQVKSGHAILLLSIFATASHSWARRDCYRDLFAKPADAHDQAPWWVKAAQDVIDIAQRTTGISLEGLQGMIILIFTMGNLEGFSRRWFAHASSCIIVARSLKLHCIDHPDNADKANTAEAEMGRRVWWYVCASDWGKAARFGGFGGVYSCHPRQMITRKPLNINDEDIYDGMSRVERPLSHPTSMSYSLQRIRLGEISRSMVDRSPLLMPGKTGLSFDDVMSIDTELQALINDLPPFFSMSRTELMETYNLNSARAEQLMDQHYTFYLCVYSLRCKLHLPFFSRGLGDAAIAQSRDICVQSARQIIQLRPSSEGNGPRPGLRFKFIAVLVGIFVASIVLLMKLCTERKLWNNEQLRGEVAEAFRMLEEAKEESDTAARFASKFTDKLTDMLRKHKVPPPRSIPTPPNQISLREATPASVPINEQMYGESLGVTSSGNTVRMLDMHQNNVVNVPADGLSNGEDLTSYFNEFTQGFGQGFDVGSFDWDSLLSGLDSSLI